MKLGRFLKAGSGGLGQLFDVKCAAAVLVCSDEMLGSAYEFRFFLHRFGFNHGRSGGRRLFFCDQFRTEGS